MIGAIRARTRDGLDGIQVRVRRVRWAQTIRALERRGGGRRNRGDDNHHALIVPSDPHTLVGARGDEAMIEAVHSAIRARHPGAEVAVITSTPQADGHAVSLGLTPKRHWMVSPRRVRAILEANVYDSVWVIGADVMDGSYDLQSTAFTLTMADLAARMGATTTVTGFSFGPNPDPRVRPFYDRVDPSVRFFARDRRSFSRFRTFSGRSADHAADVAFLLRPAATFGPSAPARDWMRRQKQSGNAVIVFNIHPMLVNRASPTEHCDLVAKAASSLKRLMDAGATSVLLLPHDHRGDLGDLVSLSPLASALAGLGDRVHLCEAVLPAAEIKALLMNADLTVAGRMHLVIASLGAGTATAGITYQGKFEGLFELFHLPPSLLLSPATLRTDSDALFNLLQELTLQRHATADVIRGALPSVMEAARRNVESLAGS